MSDFESLRTLQQQRDHVFGKGRSHLLRKYPDEDALLRVSESHLLDDNDPLVWCRTGEEGERRCFAVPLNLVPELLSLVYAIYGPSSSPLLLVHSDT